jgi:hypothetical protein
MLHQSYDSCDGGNINCQKESCLLKCYFEKAKWCLIEKFGMRLKSIDGSSKLMHSYVLKCKNLLIIYLDVQLFFHNFVDFTLRL